MSYPFGLDEVGYERYLEAGEELEIEEALRRGEAYECPGCGQVLHVDEPCPECGL